jgi:subtilisin family serine protease
MKTLSSGVCISVLCAALLAGCATPPDEESPPVPKQFRARQILVTLPSATPERWAEVAKAIEREYALQPAGEFPLTALGIQCLVFQVPAERSIAVVLTRLNADSRVALAQVNQVFQVRGTGAGDPYGPLQYDMAQIRAAAAHTVSTGKGVRIAVIDTGAETDHPDLREPVRSVNFVEGGESSFKTDRHGTAVAGVIAARAGNGIGIMGVAPAAELLITKACWYPGSQSEPALCSSWTLAKAVDHALKERARILNFSLVGPYDALLNQLLDAAQERGAIMVAAADQQGDEPGFPAAHAGVIAAIASDARGRAKAPAWTASKPALAAPGLEILSTVPRTAYDYLSGSSLAAAHVSGAIALLLEHKPGLTMTEVLDSLRSSSASSGATEMGTIEVCGALQSVLQRPVCPTVSS